MKNFTHKAPNVVHAILITNNLDFPKIEKYIFCFDA